MKKKLISIIMAVLAVVVMIASFIPFSFDGDSKQYSAGWNSDNNGWWYFDNGWYPSGQWYQIDGYWYYFTSDGYMDYSEYRDGCWLNSDGSWNTNYSDGHWDKDSVGYWYQDGKWYPTNQWVWIDGSCYYFKDNGYMAADEWIGDSYVDPNGVWVPGKVKDNSNNEPSSQGGGSWEGYKYKEDNGSYATNTDKTINGKKYHFDENGYAVTNKAVGDKYFGADGAMVTNQKVGTHLYGSDGVMVKGGIGTDNKGNAYYCDTNGVVLTNQIIKGTTGIAFYKADANGVILACENMMVEYQGKKYYCQSDGFLLRNVTNYVINGVAYDVDSDGVCTPAKGQAEVCTHNWVNHYKDEKVYTFFIQNFSSVHRNEYKNGSNADDGYTDYNNIKCQSCGTVYNSYSDYEKNDKCSIEVYTEEEYNFAKNQPYSQLNNNSCNEYIKKTYIKNQGHLYETLKEIQNYGGSWSPSIETINTITHYPVKLSEETKQVCDYQYCSKCGARKEN